MVRVATVPLRTDTVVCSGRIEAIRAVATHLPAFSTFVDVGTRTVVLSAIALGTCAITDPSRNRDAFGSLGAFSSVLASSQNALATNELVGCLALALQTVALFAHCIRVSTESRWTMAFIAAGQVLTKCIQSTRLITVLCAFVDVATLSAGLIAHESLSADAHVRAQVRILNARLARRTRIIFVAGDRNDVTLGATIAIRIACTPTRTLARVGARRVGANSTAWTWIGSALINIDTRLSGVIRRACISVRAQTLRHIIDDHTMSIRTADHSLARVTAIVAHIRLRAQASLVFVANCVAGTFAVLLAGDYSNATYPGIWIGDRARGTGTFIGTSQVIANGTLSASIRTIAFVQVHAQTLRIARKARRTLTRITSGSIFANGIVSALSRGSVDRVALVNVHATGSNVARIERPAVLTDTVRFHAVRLTEGVRSALDVFAGRLTLDPWRCANIAGETFTPVRSGRVDALCVRAASIGHVPALVNVDADRAVRLESVLAEALPLNAFGIVGTVKVTGAQYIHVPLFTGNLGVGTGAIPLRTQTVIAGRSVFAYRMIAARLLKRGTLIDVHTAAERIARIVGLARANVTANGVRAHGIRATWLVLALVYI